MFSHWYYKITAVLLSATVLLLMPLMVQAEMSDPTRPLFLKKKTPALAPKKKTAPVPVMKKKAAPEIYVLTSTLVSKQRTVAVINDRVVAVGDKVGSATVVAIESAQVRLRRGMRDITLSLATRKINKVIRGQALVNKQRLP